MKPKIEIEHWRKAKEKLWKKADKLIEAGCSTVEIGRQIGVSHVAVLKYLKRSGKHESWKEKKDAVRYSFRDELIAQGLSIEEIAVREGLATTTIRQYIKESGQQEFAIEQRIKYLASLSPEELTKEIRAEKQHLIREEYSQTYQSTDDLERAVLEAVRQYETVSSNELYKKVGIGRNTFAEILRKHQISSKQHRSHAIPIVQAKAEFYLGLEPKGNYSPVSREVVLKCILNNNPVTIYQIRQKTGVGSEIILNILKDENLVTFIPSQQRRNSKFEERIAKGATLEEIGQSAGVTRERARQYICATGQYDYWKEQKEKRNVERSEQENALHQAHQNLTSLLVARAYQRTEEGGWKYRRKALDYFYGGLKGKERKCKTKDVSTPLEKLLTLFETYEMAERLGVKLSLNEMEERTGITFVGISRILSSQGLEPFYGARERSSPLSSELNQAVERAYNLEFTSTDVAYFLKLDKTPWIVTQHFFDIKKNGAEKINRNKWLSCAKPKHFGDGLHKGDALFYRTASQIYELDDMAKAEKINFPDEEVAKLLEVRPKCVEFARKNRSEIQTDIIGLLRVLYLDKNVEKPY